MLKRGRPGIKLSDDERKTLVNILTNSEKPMTVQQAADEAGITYRQFYLPLYGANRCSPNSYKKINTFIKNHSKYKEKQIKNRREE